MKRTPDDPRVVTSDQGVKDLRNIYREIGALCGHEDPERFAEFMLAPPCQHDGVPNYDPETCPAPCGQTHDYWCDCGYPIGGCPIITEDLNA